MSQLTTEQALANDRDALQTVLINQLRQMTQAVVVVFSLYDSLREVMVIQHVDASTTLLSTIVQLLGKKMLHLETPVSREEVVEKKDQLVILFPNLTAATMGRIPPALSNAFHRITGVDRFILIQHYLLDRLYGASVIAMRADQPDPEKELLEFYASLSATSLRRIEAEEILKREQARLTMVIEGTQAGIWEWNVETGENRVDQRWAEIIGYREEEITPHIEAWKERIHPEDMPVVNEALEKVLHNHKKYYGVDFRMKHKAGHYVWVQSKGKVNTWGANDQPLWLSGTHMDITQRKKAEKAAEAANEAKSRFLTNISHEIRTPLNGIVGFANLFKLTPMDEDQQEYVDFILQATEMLLAIVEDILDLSKIKSGKMALKQQKFNLKEAVMAGTAPVKVQAEAKDVAFDVEVSQQLPADVVGDSVRVRQIIMNLTANAVKFTRQGSVRLRVEPVMDSSEVELERYLVAFVVEDTGIGMNAETLEHIFEAFYQANDSETSHQEGTGLGLSITKELVELMGGSIKAKSLKNVGTTITVTVPFGVAAASERQQVLAM